MASIHIPDEAIPADTTQEKKECMVCLLISNPNNKVTHHFVERELYTTGNREKFICEHCLDDLKLVRKLINKKIDDPSKDCINDFIPFYIREIPEAAQIWGKMNILV